MNGSVLDIVIYEPFARSCSVNSQFVIAPAPRWPTRFADGFYYCTFDWLGALLPIAIGMAQGTAECKAVIQI